MRKYLPLFAIECYLILTLLILYFGPVEFRLRNQVLFIALMVLYHGAFIFGYLVAVLVEKKSARRLKIEFSSKYFYVALFFAFIGVLGAYNNLMLSDSIIPYNFFSDLLKGASEPGLVYSDRMVNIGQGVTSESRVFNIISIFFSFFKLLFIFIFVYHWGRLDVVKKIISIIYSFLFVSSGIASGTNSVIFIFSLFLIFSLFVVLYIGGCRHMQRLIFISALLFLFPVAFFGNIMSQRGGGFEYFAQTSPLNDISGPLQYGDGQYFSIFDFLYYSFVWLDYYLVQGYYGFSLILNLDHHWTYGFGNSFFLQRQFLLITGIDVNPLTFQHRISSVWDESAQWHSFYGQFANDFGLIGLIALMFALGYFLAKTWMFALYKNSFYAAALVPIYMLMFVFFPANNQVFSYIDTLSYFIFVNMLLFFEKRK
jgi:hypothetical protein